ncbi:endonuclease/exonuclease/phosphatase family protein [Pseudomonas sp. FGI182]|uniref:endonuclease/exonuclease/phosphatase family protein n=1 Tax=Pseudomonas sp. FGI182 TaxID=1259844 RepID=UPI0012DED0E5|nr:endonuclease/exonuclease/phosphatase family protein [Pseudomonas sp. FGI182]
MDINKQDIDLSGSSTTTSITFGWWNTSLAPKGISRKCKKTRAHAKDILSYLLFANRADFIALGETSEEDFEFLRSASDFEGYSFASGTSNNSTLKFDTCYIYNPERLSVSDPENIISIKGTKKLKIAQRLEVRIAGCNSIINIFASHWPSRLWCEQNHADRDVLGIRLRDEIDALIEDSQRPPHIILLGDYNDEPFSDSLSEQLMASRDISLVRSRPHLLYNPYWNILGNGRCGSLPHGGSYFYNKGRHTRWHTFDQIIYSHAFITANTWKLSQTSAHLAEVPGLSELILSSKSKIDHIPVIGTIERAIKS